ncbi:MAG: hypothetical protein VX944_13155, partial [Myxococcota bacterium]|nr:hypothetical protein [Myxococcota bacterium]
MLRWLGLLCLVACTSAEKQSDSGSSAAPDDGSPGTVADGSTVSDDEAENIDHYMQIRARVQVELYTTNESGGREFLSWDDAVGPVGEFPFGSVFVAAYRSDDEGLESYFDQHTVTRPRVTGDVYRLDVDPDAVDSIN